MIQIQKTLSSLRVGSSPGLPWRDSRRVIPLLKPNFASIQARPRQLRFVNLSSLLGGPNLSAQPMLLTIDRTPMREYVRVVFFWR
jgi:hypothetical protein